MYVDKDVESSVSVLSQSLDPNWDIHHVSEKNTLIEFKTNTA